MCESVAISSAMSVAVIGRLHVGRRSFDDLQLFVFVRIVDADVEHEPIQLGFRQRISPFLLDRVLRRQNEERLGQLMPRAADSDLIFLHRFEQRGLRFRRRAIDFVGQHDVGKDRPAEKFERRGCRSLCLPESLPCR